MKKTTQTVFQEVALKNLESAFRDCARVGLVFIGMDSSLLAFDHEELKKAGYYNVDQAGYAPHNAMNKLNQGITVDTSKSYLDSGGW